MSSLNEEKTWQEINDIKNDQYVHKKFQVMYDMIT